MASSTDSTRSNPVETPDLSGDFEGPPNKKIKLSTSSLSSAAKISKEQIGDLKVQVNDVMSGVHTSMCGLDCGLRHHPLVLSLGVQHDSKMRQCLENHLKLAISNGWKTVKPVNDSCLNSRYPLIHLAVLFGKPEQLELLLKSGYDPSEFLDSSGNSPLHTALKHLTDVLPCSSCEDKTRTFQQMMQILIQHNNNVLYIRDSIHGDSILHLCAKKIRDLSVQIRNKESVAGNTQFEELLKQRELFETCFKVIVEQFQNLCAEETLRQSEVTVMFDSKNNAGETILTILEDDESSREESTLEAEKGDPRCKPLEETHECVQQQSAKIISTEEEEKSKLSEGPSGYERQQQGKSLCENVDDLSELTCRRPVKGNEDSHSLNEQPKCEIQLERSIECVKEPSECQKQQKEITDPDSMEQQLFDCEKEDTKPLEESSEIGMQEVQSENSEPCEKPCQHEKKQKINESHDCSEEPLETGIQQKRMVNKELSETERQEVKSNLAEELSEHERAIIKECDSSEEPLKTDMQQEGTLTDVSEESEEESLETLRQKLRREKNKPSEQSLQHKKKQRRNLECDSLEEPCETERHVSIHSVFDHLPLGMERRQIRTDSVQQEDNTMKGLTEGVTMHPRCTASDQNTSGSSKENVKELDVSEESVIAASAEISSVVHTSVNHSPLEGSLGRPTSNVKDLTVGDTMDARCTVPDLITSGSIETNTEELDVSDESETGAGAEISFVADSSVNHFQTVGSLSQPVSDVLTLEVSRVPPQLHQPKGGKGIHTPLCPSNCSMIHHQLIGLLCATPGYHSAEFNEAEHESCSEFMKFLKEKNLDANFLVPDPFSELHRPILHLACMLGKYKALEELSKFGLDPFVRSSSQETPLHTTMRLIGSGSTAFLFLPQVVANIVKTLSKHATVLSLLNATDGKGSTVLHTMAYGVLLKSSHCIVFFYLFVFRLLVSFLLSEQSGPMGADCLLELLETRNTAGHTVRQLLEKRVIGRQLLKSIANLLDAWKRKHAQSTSNSSDGFKNNQTPGCLTKPGYSYFAGHLSGQQIADVSTQECTSDLSNLTHGLPMPDSATDPLLGFDTILLEQNTHEGDSSTSGAAGDRRYPLRGRRYLEDLLDESKCHQNVSSSHTEGPSVVNVGGDDQGNKSDCVMDCLSLNADPESLVDFILYSDCKISEVTKQRIIQSFEDEYDDRMRCLKPKKTSPDQELEAKLEWKREEKNRLERKLKRIESIIKKKKDCVAKAVEKKKKLKDEESDLDGKIELIDQAIAALNELGPML